METLVQHRWSLLILASILALVTSSTLFALDPQKTIAQYGQTVWLRQNGLPANAVNTAVQSKEGYIYIGTSTGLFGFDGVNFRRIGVDPGEEKSRQTISALCSASDSSLWIGTEYKGLRRIRGGKISSYGLAEGFFDTQVLELLESRSGRMYVGTAIGVYRFDNGKFAPILLKPNFITALAEDSAGRLWIGTHHGIRIVDEERPDHVVSITTKDGLPTDITTCLFADRRGNMWIGTVSGLVRCQGGKMDRPTLLHGPSDIHINVIREDRDGNIWVGTNTGGLNRLANGKWTVLRKSDGLTDDQVSSILEDREGSLWVGTADGLNQFKNVSLTTFTTYEGLTNDYISSVVETPDKTLYFLSDQGSSVMGLRNGKFRKYQISVGPAFVAHDGRLWIGQNGYLCDIMNGKLTKYDSTCGVPQHWISAITEDDEGLIFYSDHVGIRRFVNHRVAPYLMARGEQYPSVEYVVCFYQQRKDLLWVGTTDSLVKIEGGVSVGFTKKDGLAGNWVSSIYDDKKGSLYFSSPQGGLTRYREGRFTAFNTAVGLFVDEIYCVIGDDVGGLWLSSPVGIGHVDRQELEDYAEGRVSSIHSKVFVTVDGMKTDECFGGWQPAGWKTHDGNIWFATRKGAVMIDPRKFRFNAIPPPTLIEEVDVNEHPAPDLGPVELDPGSDKLEFHYTALSFLVPSRVTFKYMLKGYDTRWVDAGTRRVAYYTNLSPGDYRFQVIACNNDGVWNETGASFPFILKPHFYETYWFYGLLLVVLGGGSFGLYRVRVWQLIRNERNLQQKVDEALANIKVLGGLIPICSNCKKIRNDAGYWDLLEGYIQSHSQAKFSHGLCPDCAKQLYPGVFPSNEGKS